MLTANKTKGFKTARNRRNWENIENHWIQFPKCARRILQYRGPKPSNFLWEAIYGKQSWNKAIFIFLGAEKVSNPITRFVAKVIWLAILFFSILGKNKITFLLCQFYVNNPLKFKKNKILVRHLSTFCTARKITISSGSKSFSPHKIFLVFWKA